MPSYLLLRNNKESGPYQLDDLVNFGLKPYDLVWVEGKSAAWRYPSEVAELKKYAPGTEEQPYDRFFKKPVAEEKKEETLVVSQASAVKEVQAEPQTATIEEKYQKYIPKKSVFVTLPGQKAVSVQKPVPAEPKPAVQAVKTETYKQPEAETTSPVIKVTENPAAQIKYSQPLDEIKEMYVKTLQQRKNKIVKRTAVYASLKKASVVVGLVAVGVAAGLIINSGKGNKNPIALQQAGSSTTVPANKPETPSQEVTVPQTLPLSAPALNTPSNLANEAGAVDRTIPVSPEDQHQLQQPMVQKQSLPTRSKKEPVTTQNETATFDTEMAIGNDPVTGERKRIMRGDDNASAKAAMKPIRTTNKPSLDKQVSVISNDYKRVAFGGIRNLELTVVNESKFILDKVTVELQYLKPSEEPLKTEIIQFNSVSPNGSLTMKVRDTNRGIKVQYKIIDIQTSTPETAMSGF